MLPFTLRHHQRVVAASTEATTAIKVKGSAELTLKRKPDTLAAMASAAVLDVA
jgi:hypothetical protein